MIANLTSNFRFYTLFEDLDLPASFLKAGLLLQNVVLNINLCTWTSRKDHEITGNFRALFKSEKLSFKVSSENREAEKF